MAKRLTIKEAKAELLDLIRYIQKYREFPNREKSLDECVDLILFCLECPACEEIMDMDLSEHKSDDRTVAFVHGLQVCQDVINKHKEQ